VLLHQALHDGQADAGPIDLRPVNDPNEIDGLRRTPTPLTHGHRWPPLNVIPCVVALQKTLLDLVTAVSTYAGSDAEVVATVVCLVNSGTVELCGTFRGARFDLASVDGTAPA